MDDEREDPFRSLAREVVGLTKEEQHGRAADLLPDLLALRRDRWEYTNKKAHVLAGMAYDAIRQGELEWATRYLDLHRQELPDHHLLPTIVDERRSVQNLLRHVAQGVPMEACPRVPRARKVAFVCPDNAVLSPVAEALARHRGGEGLHAISGGLAPADRVPPAVAEVLAEEGMPAPSVPPHRIPPEVLRRFPLVTGINLARDQVLKAEHPTRFVAWKQPAPDPDDLPALRAVRDALREAVDELLDAYRLRRADERSP